MPPRSGSRSARRPSQPLLSLAGERVDGVVVGGIGMGALVRLQAANIGVFLSEHPTVGATVDAFKAGTLQPVTPTTACGHHGAGPHGPGGGQHGPCHGPDGAER